jgi:hypothetical protein
MPVHANNSSNQRQKADIAAKTRPKVIHMRRKRIVSIIDANKIENPMPDMKQRIRCAEKYKLNCAKMVAIS